MTKKEQLLAKCSNANYLSYYVKTPANDIELTAIAGKENVIAKALYIDQTYNDDLVMIRNENVAIVDFMAH